MDENFDKMNDKQIAIFDEIFGALDGALGDEDSDGLKVLGALLSLPDEQFETIKPIFMSNIEEAFNSPEAVIGFSQMMNQQGVKIEDFTDNMDNAIEAVDQLAAEGIELSQSKKDFLKFIFTTFANTMEQTNRVSHRIITIPIELCREEAKLPTYATDGSAAMDIYSPAEYTIGPGETLMIPTGLKVNIPRGYGILIQPRSGMSRKTKLRIPNTPGLIDSDYHEEIGVLIENIDPHLRTTQLIMMAPPSYKAHSTAPHLQSVKASALLKCVWLKYRLLTGFLFHHSVNLKMTMERDSVQQELTNLQ